MIHTSDGGSTWNTQLRTIGYEQSYQRIEILNEFSIWITGFGSLFHSTDSGANWTEIPVIDGRSYLSFIKFLDETHGWTATNNILYKTVDGGLTWTNVSGWTFSDHPRNMHFLSSSEVWAIGYFGIYHSVNGAETWTRICDFGGWKLSMLDSNEGWAVSDSSLMYVSDGNNWAQKPIPSYSPIRSSRFPYFTDIKFIGNNGWIAASEVPVMYTPNGGQNWYAQSIPNHINRRLMALDFLNSTYGWAVGADGVVLKTITGTDLGTRLWNGMTDPLFLTIVGGLVCVVVVVSGGLYYRLRKRGTPSKLVPDIV